MLDSSNSLWECTWCQSKNAAIHVFCEACYQIKSSTIDSHDLYRNKRTANELIHRSTTFQYNLDHFELNPENRIYEIIKLCKMAKTHFVDDQFMPSNRSLGFDSVNNVAQWLRISATYPLSDNDYYLSWNVFSSPEPSDIEQGTLGNCWLMAALALIAERPQILSKIILTQTINNEGVYLVRLCHNGLWKTLILDDYFPCTNQNKLVFSQARRRQLYVPLIEKACAKLFGSYTHLNAGNICEGLYLLTGTPCDSINIQSSTEVLDTDIIWAKLISAYESNLLIGVSSGRTDISTEEYARIGIHDNHAFSILAVHTLTDCSLRFILVRDPHARSNYTDQQITSTILNRLQLMNVTSRSSGTFWISWPIFLRYFSTITISNYIENYFDLRHEGQFTRSSTQYLLTYRFRITETSLVNISLVHQKHNRKICHYHTQSFVLCDIDETFSFNGIGNDVNILESRQDGFTYWTGLLKPGNYILIPFSISFWRPNAKDNDYTLVIQSKFPIDLTTVQEPATLLADCLTSAVIKKYHIFTTGNDIIYYVTPNHIGLFLLIVENWSPDYYLDVDINMQHSKSVQHSRLSWNTHDCIPPFHRQLIFLTEWTDKYDSLNNITYNLKFQHTAQISHPVPLIHSDLHDLHTQRLF